MANNTDITPFTPSSGAPVPDQHQPIPLPRITLAPVQGMMAPSPPVHQSSTILAPVVVLPPANAHIHFSMALQDDKIANVRNQLDLQHHELAGVRTRLQDEAAAFKQSQKDYENFTATHRAFIDSLCQQGQAEPEQQRLEPHLKAIEQAENLHLHQAHHHKTLVWEPLRQQESNILNKVQELSDYLVNAMMVRDHLQYISAMSPVPKKKWESAKDIQDVADEKGISFYNELIAISEAENGVDELLSILRDLYQGKFHKSLALIKHWKTLTADDFAAHGVPAHEFHPNTPIIYVNKPKNAKAVLVGRLAIYFGLQKDEE